MKPAAIAAYLTLSVVLVASEPFPLKELAPSVDTLLSSENPDHSELAYIAARGTALYFSVAMVFEESGNGGERDKNVIATMKEQSEQFFKVAVMSGLISKMTQDSIKERIQTLMEVYMKEMAQSKKLNNQYFSPVILKDTESLRKIQPLVARLSGEIAKASKN